MVLVAGLLLVLIGEQALAAVPVARAVLTLGGLALVLAVSLRGALAWRRGSENAKISRLLTLTDLGCFVALLGFLAAGETGSNLIGLEFESAADRGRFSRPLLAISTMAMAVSLLPALGARWARARTQAEGVVQVTSGALSVALAGSTLSLIGYIASARDVVVDFSYFKTAMPGSAVVALAESLDAPLEVLLFFPEVDPVKDEVVRYFGALERASAHVEVREIDRFRDPSAAEYYRIARDATIILALDDRGRAAAPGARPEADTVSDPGRPAEGRVPELGRHERIGLPQTLEEARGNLRILDSFVHEALSRLTREKRVAYLTAGHGELSDGTSEGRGLALGPMTPPSEDPSEEPLLSVLRRTLQLLNYEVRDIGVAQGLADGVPDDAAMVLVVGPERPFLDGEVEAVREYLIDGGSVLFAVEPGSAFDLAPFEDLVGTLYGAGAVADEQVHGRRRGGAADRGLLITNRYADHPALGDLHRSGLGSGVLFDGSGHLETHPPSMPIDARSSDPPGAAETADPGAEWDPGAADSRPAPGAEAIARASETTTAGVSNRAGDASNGLPDRPGPGSSRTSPGAPRTTKLVLALPSSFVDLDRDLSFDPDSEARDEIVLTVATEGVPAGTPATPPGGNADDIGGGSRAGTYRALVFADADPFTDEILGALDANASMVANNLRWLGREQELAGAIASEADHPVFHTGSENVVWFYLTIFGVPVAVAAGGVAYSMGRRRRTFADGGKGRSG